MAQSSFILSGRKKLRPLRRFAEAIRIRVVEFPYRFGRLYFGTTEWLIQRSCRRYDAGYRDRRRLRSIEAIIKTRRSVEPLLSSRFTCFGALLDAHGMDFTNDVCRSFGMMTVISRRMLEASPK